MEPWKIIGVVLGGVLLVIGPALSQTLNSFFKRYLNPFSRNLEIRKQIDDLIHDIRVYVSASRVCLMEYSNTERAVNGMPFEFITMTYEKTDNYTTRIGKDFKKVHVGQFIQEMSQVHTSEHGWVKQTIQDANAEIKYNLNFYNIATAYYFKITKDLKDGCLLVQFTRNTELPEEDIAWMKDQCRTIHRLMRRLKN